MKKIKQIAIYTFLLLTVATVSYAQGPGFGDDVVDEVPLDGGVSALVIAGVAYGAKKIADRRKKIK